MKVSGLFSIRVWSAGLICVIAAGQTIAVARAQSPQAPAKAIEQTKDGPSGTAGGQFTGQSPAAAPEAMQLLARARRALAQGDVATCTECLQAAEKLGGDFTAWGDSPAKVAAMVQRQNDLVAMSKSGDAQQFNQQAAAFLMEQADQMLVHRDWQAATALIDQARKFPADFSRLGADPQALLAKIAVLRGDSTSGGDPVAACKKLMSQAQLAMDQSRWEEAQSLVQQAKAMNLPDSAFDAAQPRPWQMELVVQNAMRIQKGSSVSPAGFAGNPQSGVVKADFVPERDGSKVAPVSGTDNGSSFAGAAMNAPVPNIAAAQSQEEIDLSAIPDSEQALFRQLQSSVFKTRAEAERIISRDPQAALTKMMELRAEVANSALAEANKNPLITIVDRDIQDMQGYIQQNLPDIQNHQSNVERMERVELTREQRYQTEKQIQKLVEDFNRLCDQERYAEAEQVARQAAELDPESEISALLLEKAKMNSRVGELNELAANREDMQQHVFGRDVELLGTPMDTSMPYQHGDAEMWNRRSQMRLEALNGRQYGSETERNIWSALRNTRVQGDFRGPLSDAIAQLAQQGGVNIVFDQIALAAESVETSRPVDVPIHEPISLQSALNVVLSSVGLVFVVEDEVIKVTSKDASRKDVRTQIYYVGDLVTPIVPSQSPAQMNFITPTSPYNTQNSVLAQNGAPLMMNTANQNAVTNMTTLAQQLPGGPMGQNPFNPGWGMWDRGYNNGPQSGSPVYTTMGAPSLGGVTEADFQPLIDLIQNTIAPDEWSDTGQGDGTIRPFVPNLSLIVSQTQEVQDQIQDLLKRLRELNDVQIVVEVRFVTLRDQFFERMGIDFDFNINDHSGLTAAPGDTVPESTVVGRDPLGDRFQPTGDLDLRFGQNSFASAVPTFGGFDANTAANFGFAILSDIEVFFLIQAAKGDQRSNISQAPTVTMFNGQSASVSDGALRPFVTSVIPIVGDFAVAHQPVISILPDGTTLNVQAVASDDRRFVRMSLVPFFSQVTDVRTFTFDGSRRTRRASDNLLQDLLDQADGNDDNDDDDGTELETESQGVTVQLPVLSFTQVNTVVSVPDGGTVLLGGIKRMSEGRVERGVPMLSNLPYVNRLFKNVGIGRETSNLMMMVTPRIIIQEEEEQAQVGPVGN